MHLHTSPFLSFFLPIEPEFTLWIHNRFSVVCCLTTDLIQKKQNVLNRWQLVLIEFLWNVLIPFIDLFKLLYCVCVHLWVCDHVCASAFCLCVCERLVSSFCHPACEGKVSAGKATCHRGTWEVVANVIGLFVCVFHSPRKHHWISSTTECC